MALCFLEMLTMKPSSLLFTASMLAVLSVAAQELRDWENPKVTGVNNEPPHATMVVCPDMNTARRIEYAGNTQRVKSSFYRSLNGEWKYQYGANHAGRVANFWAKDFDDTKWKTIPVPANVEVEGYGIPIYVNE